MGDGLVDGAGAMQTYMGDTAPGSGLTSDIDIEYRCSDGDANGTVDVTRIFNWYQNQRAFTLPTPPDRVLLNAPKCTTATLYDIDGLASPPGDTAAPVITGPSGGAGAATSAVSVTEGTTSVTTLSADETVTWSKDGGVDAALFTLDASSGALSFTTAPDYEAPSDADTNNAYIVVVKATDGAGNVAAQTVTVTVLRLAYPGEPLPSQDDLDGDGSPDSLESATADRDGDGIPDSQDYDPQGYFYCLDDGRILNGGRVIVSGPGNVNMVKDGVATGEYQWFVDAPGTYTMTLNSSGIGFGPIARPSSGTLVLSSRPENPIVVGSLENGSTNYLGDYNGVPFDPMSPTQYFTSFVIARGDANVFGNNIPVSDCALGRLSVVAQQDAQEPNEGNRSNGLFRIELPRAAANDVIVQYSLSGTAEAGRDYASLSGALIIPAGDLSAALNIVALEDNISEGAETVVLTLYGVTGDAGISLPEGADAQSAMLSIYDSLVDLVSEEVRSRVVDDLQDTLVVQQGQFSGYAHAASDRLRTRSKDDPKQCNDDLRVDPDLNINVSDFQGRASGALSTERYNCAQDTYRMTETSVTLTRSEVGSLSYQGV